MTVYTYGVIPFTFWAFKLILKYLVGQFNNIKVYFFASYMKDAVRLLDTL